MSSVANRLIFKARGKNSVYTYLRETTILRVLEHSRGLFQCELPDAHTGYIECGDQEFDRYHWSRMTWTWHNEDTLTARLTGPRVDEEYEGNPTFHFDLARTNLTAIADVITNILLNADDGTEHRAWSFGPIDALANTFEPQCDDTLRLVPELAEFDLAEINDRGIDFHRDLTIPSWLAPWL